MIRLGLMDTVIGGFAYAHRDHTLVRTRFMRDESIEVFEAMVNLSSKDYMIERNNRIERAVYAYFEGDYRAMDALEVSPSGTAFQRLAWQALRLVPFGQTVSYGELSAHIGRPNSSRAMGAAMGANPMPLVVPCHRVIGRSGQLVGFGAGIDLKVALLKHEGQLLSL
jgi:O-6-methylguanine DNA methyltransferase